MDRQRRSCICLMAACLLLAAGDAVSAESFIRDDIITDPAPARFSVCHGFSCALVTQVSLTDVEWVTISSVFEHAAVSPEQERVQIARAIAQFETVVGRLTGTYGDLPRNQVTSGGYLAGQMDCIDESTNTTTYLRVLAGAGLLRWHAVERSITRGWFVLGWPHTSAVVSDRQSGRRWVVDSWFYANGEPPAIQPVEIWRRAGWRPDRPVTLADPP